LEQRIKPALTSYNAHAGRELANLAREMRERIVARAASIARQLGQPPPNAAKFVEGVFRPGNWRQQDEERTANLEKSKGADGKETLTISTTRETVASWRSRVVLDAGRYRFEGLARSSRLKAVSDEKGVGAGLRISGTEHPRPNSLAGDSDWKKLEFEFSVEGPADEVELVCELRATAGQVWFELNSLKLVKIK
jgi:hypothetical protein